MTNSPHTDSDEPIEFAWLEEIHGERALAWVQERNAETLARLNDDPRFETAQRTLQSVPNAIDRLGPPVLASGWVHEKATLPAHPAGAWIRTRLADYGQANALHEVLLDLREIPAHDGTPCSWLWFGVGGDPVFCAEDPNRCLLRFSVGGSDRVIQREFDIANRRFVDGGFHIDMPSIVDVAWLDRDTLLVLAELAPEERTLGGWPRVARRWGRGTVLADTPVTFDPGACTLLKLARGAPAGRRMQLVNVLRDYVTCELWLLEPGQPDRRLPLPSGLGTAGACGLACGQLIFQSATAATVCGVSLAAGSLASFDLAAWQRGQVDDLVHLVFEGSDGRVLNTTFSMPAVSATPSALWYVTIENVRPCLNRAHFANGCWTSRLAPLPAWHNVMLSQPDGDRLLLALQSFVDAPQTQLINSSDDGQPRLLKRSAPLVDLSSYCVEQRWATSRDGTRVPYFLLRSGSAVGPSPTMLHAYGGFGLNITPQYFGAYVGCDAMLPWMASGGTFVVANIRGGGELGPTWATSATGANRQRSFDDLYAVAEALIAEGVTTPEQLAASGLSNGGLLTSVALTQRPELFRAILSGVPLTDMARYHKLLVGASWIAEYGNPDIPDQREWVMKYSPLHHIQPAINYPEALYYSTTTDDRVHPGHARRMVAKLRAMGHAVLYYEAARGGHGGSSTASEAALMGAIQATYLMQKTGLGTKPPGPDATDAAYRRSSPASLN